MVGRETGTGLVAWLTASMLALALAGILAGAGCDDDGDSPGQPTADVDEDTGEDAGTDGDAAADPDGGADADAGPTGPPPLLGGFGEADLGFPLGTATTGYGPIQSQPSPWAILYPASLAQHTDLTSKAVVLQRGDTKLALVRTDTLGIWQDLVDDVRAVLREAGRPALADGLVVAGTHTHASGGRVFDHFIGEVAVGLFLPGMYQRVRDGIAESVLTADDRLEPVRLGHTTVQVPELHSDRRCENGPVQDDTMGLIRVDRADGSTLAVLVNYAMHGTVIGQKTFVLSSDAPGAVEHGLEAALEGAPPVLYMQSWAGDMAPRGPDEAATDAGHDLHEDYVDLSKIAKSAGALVAEAVAGIETSDGPEVVLDVLNVRVPLIAEQINPDGVFDAYPHGGIYCVPEGDNCEEGAVPYTPETIGCVAVPEEHTVAYTAMAGVRLGDLLLVTLPGEPTTSIGTELRDRALAATGASDVFVLGYAQSYLAYLLHPDDWWMGGYEASGSLMGPGFGVYLIEAGEGVARHLWDREQPLGFEPAEDTKDTPSIQYDDLGYETALDEPAVVTQVDSESDVLTLRWVGGHPVPDQPVVTLEREGDDGWEPMRHASGEVWTSNGPAIELAVFPDPPWGDAIALDARRFEWEARMPRRFAVPPLADDGQLEGTFRFVVRGARPDAYQLTGEAFTLAP